jgi:fimbrial chaperone protein
MTVRGFASAALMAAFALAAATDAGAFQLSPISQDFEPSGRGATHTFRVDNELDEQVAVTVEMAVREVDVDGNETNKSTDDFVVFPPQFMLGPKKVQVVRMQWVGDQAPKQELAYRIVAEQSPVRVARSTPGASISLAVRYIGSIYVVPRGVYPKIEVESAAAAAGPDGKPRLHLVLVNEGTSHAIIDEPSLKLSAGDKSVTLTGDAVKPVAGENILAGQKRRFVMAWPEGLTVGPVQAQIAFVPLR